MAMLPSRRARAARVAAAPVVGKERVGNDDDIVAKRLRKAAEEETDPELKERLWKEYNDYKKAAS